MHGGRPPAHYAAVAKAAACRRKQSSILRTGLLQAVDATEYSSLQEGRQR
jgi:hypothetical protein